MQAEALPGAAALLRGLGLPEDAELFPLTGGANNRVYRAEGDGRAVALKAYFHHPADTRDRLATEFGFLRFLWARGLRSAPEPLACDAVQQLAAYEWLAGRRLQPAEVTHHRIEEALAFYRAINEHRHAPEAAALPTGSEACFSLAAHVQTVERRLRRLQHLTPQSDIAHHAFDFITTALTPAWAEIASEVQRRARALALPLGAELAPTDRRLSPSDFGYHNALLTAEGRLRFIDFEYAGWDDPAKLVCDFFCQPAVPAPPQYFEPFVETIAADLSDPAWHRARMRLLWPVYQIKWVCIRLNNFLPVGAERRQYSGAAEDHQTRQLQAAQTALAALASQPV